MQVRSSMTGSAGGASGVPPAQASTSSVCLDVQSEHAILDRDPEIFGASHVVSHQHRTSTMHVGELVNTQAACESDESNVLSLTCFVVNLYGK